MKKNFAFFTTGDFAKLHNINKRTLHYYDDVGIFSPKYKEKNGYRYYSYYQSIELENILALRELNMSIEDIKNYLKNPNVIDFQNIAKNKIDEIEKTIIKMTKLKTILEEKYRLLDLCKNVYDGKIEIVNLDSEYLLMTPLDYNNKSNVLNYSNTIMNHLKNTWKFSDYKKSCGSYISLEKIQSSNFENYDGVFTSIGKKRKEFYIKPSGKYIRGFCIGYWDKIPQLYMKILEFAKERDLVLTGYAFECGLNEFAISDESEYITQIEILCNCN